MKNLISLLVILTISGCLSSCTTSRKLNNKKQFKTAVFSYKDAGIKSLTCNVVTDLTTKAAQIGRAAHILSNEEIASLAKLKINVTLSSESIEKVRFTFPELRPFSNELAKNKLGPFVDASIKIVEADLLVINTLLALPVLDEDTSDIVLSDTKEYYTFKSSSKNYKSITVFKDSSKVILEPTDIKEGIKTTVNSSKAANSNYYLIRDSQGTNPDKDIQYSFNFTYEFQENNPVPSTVKISKKDFDIALNYSYTFKDCKIVN